MDDLTVLLDEGLARLEIDLDAAARARLLAYMMLLKKWSEKINLIAKNSHDTEIVEHFLDSLALLPLFSDAPDAPATRLVDVGSGAGFPGLVLAAARPRLAIELIEPRQKRAAFLRQVIRSLHLPHVVCHECRLEDISAQSRQSITCTHIASRAVADIAGFLPMIEPWLVEGVKIICMKSRKWPEELAQARFVISRLNLDQPQVATYRLPFSGAERVTLVFAVGGEKARDRG